jgi:hypothetical protein
MSTFDRRSLFAAAAAAAVGAVRTPDWLRRAFAIQDPVSEWRTKQLRAAVAKAKDEGKPLLVFVVPPPKVPNDCRLRGMWLGAWLFHATPIALHGVAMCTLACATIEELQQVTGAKRPDTDPTMLLVDVSHVGEPSAPAPKVTAMLVELGPIRGGRNNSPEADEAGKKSMEAGFEKLTMALQDGLNRHGVAVARLATDVTARLSAAQRGQLRDWLAGGAAPSDELIVRAAAEVRRGAAELADGKRALVLERLTQAVTKEVVRKDVAGATWQSDSCPPCGMAAVPPLCERFLDFFIAGK